MMPDCIDIDLVLLPEAGSQTRRDVTPRRVASINPAMDFKCVCVVRTVQRGCCRRRRRRGMGSTAEAVDGGGGGGGRCAGEPACTWQAGGVLAFSNARNTMPTRNARRFNHAGHGFEIRVRRQDCATRLDSRRIAETCSRRVIWRVAQKLTSGQTRRCLI